MRKPCVVPKGTGIWFRSTQAWWPWSEKTPAGGEELPYSQGRCWWQAGKAQGKAVMLGSFLLQLQCHQKCLQQKSPSFRRHSSLPYPLSWGEIHHPNWRTDPPAHHQHRERQGLQRPPRYLGPWRQLSRQPPAHRMFTPAFLGLWRARPVSTCLGMDSPPSLVAAVADTKKLEGEGSGGAKAKPTPLLPCSQQKRSLYVVTAIHRCVSQ